MTLLAQWAARCERVAWVQLDDDDRGPRLWAAVLTGLGELVGGLDEALDAAEAPDADLRAGVLIALLDALAAAPPLTLVLDDLHLVVDEPADPRQPRLGPRPPARRRTACCSPRAATSTLPALARGRIRGEVLDVRTDDLRFAAGEAERFLGDRLGLALAAGRGRRRWTRAPRAGPPRCTSRRCGCGWATTSRRDRARSATRTSSAR